MDVRAENRVRPHQKSAFFCGPGDGEKLFDPRASGRKGQECPREIRTEKFTFMLFFFPEVRGAGFFRSITMAVVDASASIGNGRNTLGVLSHHLKCEMRSPHLVDFS